MKTFWFQLTGLLSLILLATFLTFNPQYLNGLVGSFRPTASNTPTTNNDSLKKIKITSPDGSIKAELEVEIADTKEKRSKGLGFRESLATNSAMLFIHENSQKYTYWMKGMQFPIDIMWIKDDTIADIIPNIPPPIAGQSDDTLERYASTVDVNRVLETNSGFVNQYGIQKGDKIVFN